MYSLLITALFETLDINNKMKKNPDWNYGIITCKDAQEQQSIYSKLHDKEHKSLILSVELMEPIVARVVKPRLENINDTRTPTERLNDQVTPLWRLSYVLPLPFNQK